jgi:hypothetical protein
LAIFKKRLPPKRDIVLVFAACAVPVYSWSIVAFLERMPGWLLFLSLWDLMGAFAYTQAFAFLESAAVLLALILLSVILPARFLRDRFIAQGGMIVFLTVAWAVALRYARGNASVAFWSLKTLLLWLVLYSVSVGVPCLLINRYGRLEHIIDALVERLTVLLYFYVPITLLSIVVVILRNI